MENKVGEQSNRKGKRKREDFSDATNKVDEQSNHTKRNRFSDATHNTVSKIKRNRYHRCTGNERVVCTIHDHSSPGYGWLLPGWVAEERHMVSGRIYRYYYDPEGYQYRSRNVVMAILENAGMVVIDN
ncbi:hypothetical protein VNO77_11469 [Canavalia gladiata]|uniref:MBD domain-containing protein n=1 Tax=Canavalia gladiata TaxID=3824 RepID=A0AAN9MCX7_CANGL